MKKFAIVIIVISAFLMQGYGTYGSEMHQNGKNQRSQTERSQIICHATFSSEKFLNTGICCMAYLACRGWQH